MSIHFAKAGLWLTLALALGTTAVACNKSTVEPQLASSSGQVGYAEGYPDTVAATIAALEQAEGESRQLSEGFAGYADALSGEEVDRATVAEMFERAAAAGRSGAYVERAEQLAGARTFFNDEKDEIHKKVAGSVGYVAKQASCNADVQSAAVVSLDKVVKERLEAQLREANDAQRLLQRERSALGDKNAAILQAQLDDVTRASYLSHIAMVRHKVALRRLIGEASAVEDTIDKAIASEQEYQATEGRSDDAKANSAQRVEALQASLSKLGAAKKDAKKTEVGIEARIKQAQKTFRDALDALLTALRGA